MILLLSVALAGPEPPVVVSSTAVDAQRAQADAIRRTLGIHPNTLGIGQFVTVTIDEATYAQLGASTNTTRTSGADAQVSGVFGLVTQMVGANPTMAFGAEDTIGLGAETGTNHAGDGSTGRSSSIVGVVTCEVIEVSATGNLRVWGYSMKTTNHETETLTVDGWIRPQDVTGDNTVASERMAEVHIELKGDGVLDDKQRVGLGTRLLDHAWPF